MQEISIFLQRIILILVKFIFKCIHIYSYLFIFFSYENGSYAKFYKKYKENRKFYKM